MDHSPSRPPLPMLARVSNLLARGEVVSLGADDDGEIFLWVSAINEVQREEAQLDAATALAAERLLTHPDSEAMETLEGWLEELSREDITQRLLEDHALEGWTTAADVLEADEYWRGDEGRLMLIQRGDEMIKVGQMTDGQQEQFARLNEEYLAQLTQKCEEHLARIKSELDTKSDADLAEAFRDSWRQGRCVSIQLACYRYTLLLYAVRVCHGVRTEGASGVGEGVSHAACGGHRTMLFESRDQVRAAPDELVQAVQPIADGLDREGAAALGK